MKCRNILLRPSQPFTIKTIVDIVPDIASSVFLLPMLTGGNMIKDMMTKFYTTQEQALIDILKAHPNSTIAEMKMHSGLRKRNDVPHALNGLRIKRVILHTGDKPARYSFSDSGQ